MARTKISEFSATPANNTDIDSINIAEGCAPSGINDAIRELMAQLKDFQTGAVGDSFNGPVGTTTAAAGAFTTLSSTGNTTLGDASGDAVTVNGTATFANANPTLTAGTANGVTYLNGSKVLTSGSALNFDGTNLSVGNSGLTGDRNVRVINSTGNSTFGTYGGSGYGSLTSGDAYTYTAKNIVLMADDAAASIKFSAGGSAEQMRLTSTGLGIGTSSPGAKLGVTTATAGFATILTNTNGASDSNGLYVKSGTVSTEYNLRLSNTSGSTDFMSVKGDGNVGIGTSSPSVKLDVNGTNGIGRFNSSDANGAYVTFANNGTAKGYIGSAIQIVTSGSANDFAIQAVNNFVFATGGAAERMRIDSSGNLGIGTSSPSYRLEVFQGGSVNVFQVQGNATDGSALARYHQSANSGDNGFIAFLTETTPTTRGSITYNRAGGLVAYNVTSDYRAKDIYGPVVDSGALIDATPVYMGKMKDATQERPMFIAHEVPSYARTGEKDAVDADGNPVYQQMDASALIPVMWAEIQSLRVRVAQLETN